MDRSSYTYQADTSLGCTSTGWNRDQTQPPKLPAQTATPKSDDYRGQKESSPPGNPKARLSAYDCRPVAAKKAGYCYDYLLNLCMPKDHIPLPKELIERITSQNYETRTRLVNDLESNLQYAEWLADHGDKVQMEKHIRRAQRNAKELDLDISNLLPSTDEENVQRIRVNVWKIISNLPESMHMKGTGSRWTLTFSKHTIMQDC